MGQLTSYFFGYKLLPKGTTTRTGNYPSSKGGNSTIRSKIGGGISYCYITYGFCYYTAIGCSCIIGGYY